MAGYAAENGAGQLIAVRAGKTKGTTHMIDKAKESDLTIFIYDTKHRCYAYDNRGWIPDT